MIRIENVENKDEKTKVTLEIMNALPEWFSSVRRSSCLL